MPSSVTDSTVLPVLTPRTHCVLMVRDPNIIYAYWDFSTKDRQRLQTQSAHQDLRLVLRVYDITLIKFNGSNANHAWDIEVSPSSMNAYINVWRDNASYCVEPGIRSGKTFIPLTRSNAVRTPAKTASTRDDLIWQDIKSQKESQPYLQEEIKKDAHHQEMILPSKKEFHQQKQQRSPRIYHLTAKDIRAYYMKFFHGKTKRQRQGASLRSVVKGLPGGILWQKVRPVVTALELIRRIHPGASETELIAKKGASENFLEFGTQASEGRLNKRQFFFEIATELVVHGRTEPDAAVWLNEKGITLNPDGTFTLRYALPDAEIPLKFMARSCDGMEERHIETRVERAKTEYHGP